MMSVSARPAAFCCEVEYGPNVNTMKSLGTVKFSGFRSDFLLMLHSLGLEKLWISKSLETSYIARYFVPVSEPFDYPYTRHFLPTFFLFFPRPNLPFC